ncbi:MAG: hypothetical protein EBZ48_04675 [Proteobacteria bacterium]|nr:hypothetical protein [Pseudomonadota bacterium]
MRVLLTIFFALCTCMIAGASSVAAQERVSSYGFAPSRHVVVEKKSAGFGQLFDSIDQSFNPLRGERGTTLLVGCVGLAALALILGMPFAALVAGGIAALLMLLNKPILLGGVFGALILCRKQLFELLLASEQDEKDVKKDGEKPSAEAAQSSKKQLSKASDPAQAAQQQQPNSSGIPKLARPL